MNKEALKYWVPTVVFSLFMAAGGVMDAMRPPDVIEAMAHLGFPAWFALWLGVCKLVGVAITLAPGLPRLKEWAMAGFAINLTSASVAHVAAADPAYAFALPLVTLAVGLAGWWWRPASRRL